MRIFNPDGSEAEKSGNGLRIFSRYLWDQKLIGTDEVALETAGGVVKVTVFDSGKTVRVLVFAKSGPAAETAKGAGAENVGFDDMIKKCQKGWSDFDVAVATPEAMGEEAAGYFKGAVKQERWEEMLQAVRTPLGKVISREVKSRSHHTSLPSAPDGEYVVIQFETSFENKKSGIETVTPMLD